MQQEPQFDEMKGIVKTLQFFKICCDESACFSEVDLH